MAPGPTASVSAFADLAGAFDSIAAGESTLPLSLSDDELAIPASYSKAPSLIELHVTWEFDDSITVTPPDGPFEVRTESAVAALVESAVQVT